MDRIERWDSELTYFAERVRRDDYAWGQTDCASIVRRGLMLLYGKDIWKGAVPSYRSIKGAVRVAGSHDIIEVLEGTGAKEIQPGFATAGDVAVLSDPEYPLPRVALLIMGRKALVSDPDKGVSIIDHLLLNDPRFFRYE